MLSAFRGRAVVCQRLSTDFRSATAIVPVEINASVLKPHQVLVQNLWVGINASDVNFTAGRYLTGAKLPLRCGFEAVSRVVAAGAEAGFSPGDPVAVASFGTFSDFQVVNAATLLPLPTLHPAFLPLVVSGLTASIALRRVGELRAGETVLVTAAAGGTGQYAVQLAKAAGCTVIGTCSSATKASALRALGCDRPVDTSSESLDAVLSAEFSAGVDVVYESVGGETFETAARHLAVGGRLVVIGFVSGYMQPSPAGAVESGALTSAGLSTSLLSRSASVRGFFLPHFAADIPAHFEELVRGVVEGRLAPGLDARCAAGEFRGLEAIAGAVEYLYSRRSAGKVFVALEAASDGTVGLLPPRPPSGKHEPEAGDDRATLPASPRL